MYTNHFLSPLRGLVHDLLNFPTAYAVGCILSPLRGYPNLAGSIFTRSSLAGCDILLLSHVKQFLDLGNHGSLVVFHLYRKNGLVFRQCLQLLTNVV